MKGAPADRRLQTLSGGGRLVTDSLASRDREIRDLAKIQIEEAGPNLFGLAAWLDFASPGWREQFQAKKEEGD